MGIPLLYLLLLVSARGAIAKDQPTQLSSALSFLHRDFEARMLSLTPTLALALTPSLSPKPNPNPNPHPYPYPHPHSNQARMYGWEIAEQFKKLFLVGIMLQPSP